RLAPHNRAGRGAYCAALKRPSYARGRNALCSLRIRSIMDDGDKFPKTFDEWERTAKHRLASAAAAGVTIQPVTIDPGEFLAYCKSQSFSARGDRERNMFARASAKKAASDRA